MPHEFTGGNYALSLWFQKGRVSAFGGIIRFRATIASVCLLGHARTTWSPCRQVRARQRAGRLQLLGELHAATDGRGRNTDRSQSKPQYVVTVHTFHALVISRRALAAVRAG